MVSEETFSYDEAGNLTENYSEQGQNCFEYTSNNRLNSHNGYYVSYDKDGNITSVVLNGSRKTLKYDSTNKLISAGQNAYTYNAENTRVKNLCGGIETTYVYDTNAKLSKLLTKTTGGLTTKYVYGRGLIGEETASTFRTYHFDYRGSTVALTNINGLVTDTFEYDTYGKLISRTGSTKILFMYNGRDGVVTDDNGLIYMRARYYSPELRRFINSDIIAGEITEAITLNRYAYANGNPVSNVDPLGLSVERGEKGGWWSGVKDWFCDTKEWLDENVRNKDGSYSLHDNQRFKNSVYHEQILAFTPSGPSFNLKEGNIGLGSLAVDGYTGGWEGDYVDLSLFDFGHAEASLEMNDYQVSVGAFASIWSPSISVNILGVKLEIGAEIGAVGASLELGAHGFKVKAADAIGFTFGITW